MIVIYGWMTKKLHLKSSRLLTFAAIYGNKNGVADGHIQYSGIIEDLGFSRTSFFRAREWLVQNGLIQYDDGPDGRIIRVTDSALALIESSETETSSETRTGTLTLKKREPRIPSPARKTITSKPPTPEEGQSEDTPEMKPIAAPRIEQEATPESEPKVTPDPAHVEPDSNSEAVPKLKPEAEPDATPVAESQKRALENFCLHFKVKPDMTEKTVEEFLRGKSVETLWASFERSPGFLQAKPFTHSLKWIDRFYDRIEAGRYDDREFKTQQLGIDEPTEKQKD